MPPCWSIRMMSDALADALRRLLTDEALRADLIRRGFEQAAYFTWERAAQQLRDIYQQLIIVNVAADQ